MLVHDIVEYESLSLDQLINILLWREALRPVDHDVTLAPIAGRAESLANGIFSPPATE
jgi:hypothetical protein